MDSIEAAIIRELAGPDGTYPWNVRESFSKIAHKLGIDQKTVWRRTRNLERLGILQAREVVVNPFFIGHVPIRIILNLPNHEKTKETVISQLKRVDGTILILDWQGATLHMLVFCENELAISRKVQLVCTISGCDDPLILRNSEALGFYETRLRATPKDLVILRSMRKSPRKRVQQIAREVHLSTRTVERRIDSLTAQRAFFHMVGVGFQNVDGLACSMFVFYSDESKKSATDTAIASKLQRLIFSATNGTKISEFTFVCKNAAEAEDLKRSAQTLEGVARIMMGLVTRYILVTDWLDYVIEQLILQRK
jgi:DNA-binding Lrp family transcriptional regulator